MAVDTPARIAILGAGPIGLEAALYARFLGYEVELFERHTPASHVLQWGHVRMFTPFAMNCSSLGRAALAAQDDAYRPPADDQLLTGRQWADSYLLPLAASDLLVDQIRSHREVLAVGRQDLTKGELPGDPDRDESPFRILSRDAEGREFLSEAEIVIDTSGVFGNANWTGRGGIPARGELGLREKLEYGLPDILGTHRSMYAGRHTLVVGSGYSAATTVVALAELQRQEPATRVTWVTRPAEPRAQEGPVPRLADDRLPERDRLAAESNRLALAPPAGFVHLAGQSVEAIAELDSPADSAETAGGFLVTLANPAQTLSVDRIVANVGYRPDWQPLRELQLHTCYATEGPLKLAAALLGKATTDCLDSGGQGVDTLRHPEPNLYVLGAKSYGRNSNFLFATGLEQIRRLFALIGDRENLDLYAGARTLPQ